MKKIVALLCLCLNLSHSSVANAYFVKENSNEKLIAKVIDGYVYVAYKKGDKIILINDYGIEWKEMRKAMRIDTYMNKALIAGWLFPTVNFISFASNLGVAAHASLFYVASSFIMSSIGKDDTTQFLLGLPPFPASFGIGERIIRGQRLTNLVSSKSYEINEKRFIKIIDIIPTLRFSKLKPSSTEMFN